MPRVIYSLLSGTDAASCRAKQKSVSAQWSRLLQGSTISRRVVSEDGAVRSSVDNTSSMSKAAAWMWHTRGIGHAAVLPTKQRPILTREINTRKLQQPIRFKAEAYNMAPAVQLHTSSSAHESQASHDALETKHESERRSTFLYDEFELSCLQEMLQRSEIDKHSAQQQQQLVSHDIIPYPRKISYSTSSPSPPASHSRQIKPLSAIHKLFKRLYTTVHNSTRNNSAAPTGLDPRKVRSVQHVIHHHHHHYHHYNRSLDLPAHESQSAAPTSHLHGFVRRRRANSESCSELAQRSNNIIDLDLVDDSLYADANHRP